MEIVARARHSTWGRGDGVDECGRSPLWKVICLEYVFRLPMEILESRSRDHPFQLPFPTYDHRSVTRWQYY